MSNETDLWRNLTYAHAQFLVDMSCMEENRHLLVFGERVVLSIIYLHFVYCSQNPTDASSSVEKENSAFFVSVPPPPPPPSPLFFCSCWLLLLFFCFEFCCCLFSFCFVLLSPSRGSRVTLTCRLISQNVLQHSLIAQALGATVFVTHLQNAGKLTTLSERTKGYICMQAIQNR